MTKLNPDGTPAKGWDVPVRPGAGFSGGNHFAHGITLRRHSGQPGATHPVREMRDEALRLYQDQLEQLILAGCVECGDPVAVIAYPPDWEAQMISNGRYPGVEATKAIEVRVRVRLLCARCAESEALW